MKKKTSHFYEASINISLTYFLGLELAKLKE